MAIKRGSKVDPSFSQSSMSDIVFLLLVFLLITTTMINPNALKLNLPKGTNKVKDKAYTTVSITSDLKYFVDKEQVSFNDIETTLSSKLASEEKPIVSIHCDKTVSVDEFAKVMNVLAKNSKYQLVMALSPN